MGRIYYNDNGIILNNGKIVYETTTTLPPLPNFNISYDGSAYNSNTECGVYWYIQQNHGTFKRDDSVGISLYYYNWWMPSNTTGIYASLTGTFCNGQSQRDYYSNSTSNAFYFS